MSIVRGPRPTQNFYVVDKQISEDGKLSWAARGMLVFLLGKPDHWSVSVQALVNETSSSASTSGRDAVYRILKDLQDCGYVQKIQRNGGDGKFSEVDYIVSDQPLTDKPLTDKPLTDKPLTANPTLVSTDKAVRIEKAARTEKNNTPLPPEEGLPSFIPKNTWDDFVSARKAMKAPMTDVAKGMIFKKLMNLKEAGDDPAEVLEQSIMNSWKGVFALKKVSGGGWSDRNAEVMAKLTGNYRHDRDEDSSGCPFIVDI